MVARAGFEPAKAEPTDLQSVPFGRSGISPMSNLVALITTFVEKQNRDFLNYFNFYRSYFLKLVHLEPISRIKYAQDLIGEPSFHPAF